MPIMIIVLFSFIVIIWGTWFETVSNQAKYNNKCISMWYSLYNDDSNKCQKFNSGWTLEKEVVVNFFK